MKCRDGGRIEPPWDWEGVVVFVFWWVGSYVGGSVLWWLSGSFVGHDCIRFLLQVNESVLGVFKVGFLSLNVVQYLVPSSSPSHSSTATSQRHNRTSKKMVDKENKKSRACPATRLESAANELRRAKSEELRRRTRLCMKMQLSIDRV